MYKYWQRLFQLQVPTYPSGTIILASSQLLLHAQSSLVPRLPRSGTRTLKFCRRGEPGIFSHVRSGKDRRKVDTNLIVRGRMRLRTEKGTKVAGNLLHVSSYRVSDIIHTDRWSIVGWTTRKTLPFYFGPILITSCLRKRYRALRAINIRVPGEPGNEANPERNLYGNVSALQLVLQVSLRGFCIKHKSQFQEHLIMKSCAVFSGP